MLYKLLDHANLGTNEYDDLKEKQKHEKSLRLKMMGKVCGWGVYFYYPLPTASAYCSRPGAGNSPSKF